MFTIRRIEEKDKDFVKQALKNLWGSEEIVYCGKMYDGSTLPGFLAVESERIVGLVTYIVEESICQIISINALTPGQGIGTKLIEAVIQKAKENNCTSLLVITTNDNIEALRFYQKKGFVLKAVHVNALEKSRKIKPEIPFIGEHGIPLRDEIELEMNIS